MHILDDLLVATAGIWYYSYLFGEQNANELSQVSLVNHSVTDLN